MNDDAIGWPLWKRTAFRFFGVYFLLYALPFPFDVIPGAGLWFDVKWNSLWTVVVLRVAKLFVDRPISVATAGSSDMTWSYIQIVCYIVIAAVVALAWAIVDRKRRVNDARLHQYVHTFLRLYVASAMFSYGIQKLIPTQFVPPSLDRLVQTLGTISPMGMMWTFMGISRTYEMFAGTTELLAAILLVPRRTTLLGVLITIGVMSNVVALNLSFDVSVKTFAMHLLFMSVFLAAPDAKKLANFFLFRPPDRLFEKPWAHRASLVLRTLLVAVFVYTGVSECVTFYRQRISLDHRSPLRGIWNVDALEVDGVARPPLVTDATRWRRVVFDYQGQGSIFLMNDDRNLYRTKIDEAKKTIQFTNRFEAADLFGLTYARVGAATLQLDGRVAGHTMHAVCKLDNRQFLLTSRGFHWINERALNR